MIFILEEKRRKLDSDQEEEEEFIGSLNFDRFKEIYDSFIDEDFPSNFLLQQLDKLVKIAINQLRRYSENKEEDLLKVLNYNLKQQAEIKSNPDFDEEDIDSDLDSGYCSETLEDILIEDEFIH